MKLAFGRGIEQGDDALFESLQDASLQRDEKVPIYPAEDDLQGFERRHEGPKYRELSAKLGPNHPHSMAVYRQDRSSLVEAIYIPSLSELPCCW